MSKDAEGVDKNAITRNNEQVRRVLQMLRRALLSLVRLIEKELSSLK